MELLIGIIVGFSSYHLLLKILRIKLITKIILERIWELGSDYGPTTVTKDSKKAFDKVWEDL